MADIVKRVSLTTDEDNPADLLANGSAAPTVVIDNVGGLNRMTITFFITAFDVDDTQSMTPAEIIEAESKFIDLKLDANNNVFGGAFSINVAKNDDSNIVLNIGSTLNDKPPHGPLI